MNTTASYSSEHSWLATPCHSRRGSIESELSIQGKETDYVRDTSDTDCASDKGEYEPVTEPEEDGPLDSNLSSGPSDEETIIKTKVIEISVGDDGDIEFADSERTGSGDSDSEIDLYDYWKCAQCRAENNNPLYRFCEKCYKVRKSFYPPRPRKNKPKRVSEVPRTWSFDSGVESAFNSQELSQPDLSQRADLSQPTEFSQPTELSQPTEISQPTELSQETEVNGPTEVSQPTDISQPTDLSEKTEINGPAELSETTEFSQITDVSGPTELSEPTELSQETEVSGPAELSEPTEFSQITYVSESIELFEQTEGELTELSQPTELSQRTELFLPSDLSQPTNQDDHEGTSSTQQIKNIISNVILGRTFKRRAESADRYSKRLKLDSSDSDSDSESDAEPRRRKARSADPEVAKLVKTVSDPAITVEDTLKLTKKAIINSLKEKIDDDNLCIICFAKPKSAVFVHGRIAHICTCYECGNKVWRKAKRCPQCNCKVSNVLKVM